MLHPSYVEMIEAANAIVDEGEEPIITSRYSIVMAASKRARQIIAGDDPMAHSKSGKPLSDAVQELYEGKVQIVGGEEE